MILKEMFESTQKNIGMPDGVYPNESVLSYSAQVQHKDKTLESEDTIP